MTIRKAGSKEFEPNSQQAKELAAIHDRSEIEKKAAKDAKQTKKPGKQSNAVGDDNE